MADAEFESAVQGVGALAEPVRRGLYQYVVAQPDAVSREQAARACEVPVHSAKFHLDRLVTAGLLDVEYRRLSGRTGPGAGRPAKLYRRSQAEVTVSLPQRRYDLAGDLLAEAIDRAGTDGRPLPEVVAEVAASYGRDAAATSPPGTGTDLERVAAALARHGYEPHTTDETICLVNCPFDRLARKHTDLVCGMNLSLVTGLLDGLRAETVEAFLEPDPVLCCVRAHRRPDSTAPQARAQQ